MCAEVSDATAKSVARTQMNIRTMKGERKGGACSLWLARVVVLSKMSGRGALSLAAADGSVGGVDLWLVPSLCLPMLGGWAESPSGHHALALAVADGDEAELRWHALGRVAL